MTARLLFIGLALCAMVAGCETTAHYVSQDPLLLSKHPVNGTGASERSALLARSEPVPPALPYEAIVSARQPASRAYAEAAALAANGPAATEKSLRDSEQTEKANSRLPEKMPIAALPVTRPLNKGVYGAALDHSWLKGIVVKTAPGGIELRYGAPWPGGTDPYRVLLLPDVRLQELHQGDQIRVEGEMSPNSSAPFLPFFRIKNLTRLSTDS